ncbi:hypothetical protein EVAR_91199_1 [Eumeta japonica]|uniref:Uncharacterized protein n=1 Tax=Eumeta variegata TaxID=151549 RepID=A0A4C1ZNP7_EUMVA|nr:hypothetical protein EVAR_91199_1 [Eumeta japonica]
MTIDVDPNANAVAPPDAAASTGMIAQRVCGYSPIVVENLHNWDGTTISLGGGAARPPVYVVLLRAGDQKIRRLPVDIVPNMIVAAGA